jgi:ADP-ribose pyrophosphatase YjhB (NUDIX family)
MANPKWLDWAQRVNALAQSGLAYTQNPFDIERYRALQQLAAQMIAAQGEEDPQTVLNLLSGEPGYATPKLDIRGVVFQHGKILLVKELSDGGWTLPGGFVDVNESPSTAVEREVREESGYQVKARKLLALYDRNKHGHPAYLFHLYKIYFLCDLLGGSPATSIETGGAQFFGPDEIPSLSETRTTFEIIQRMFELASHPEWPADFD